MSKRSFKSAVALVTGAVLAAALPPPARGATTRRPVGEILNVTGRVEVRRGPQRLKGDLLFWLQRGDRVAVADRGSAEIVLFRNAARFTLPARCTARVEPATLKPLSGPHPQPLPKLSPAAVRRAAMPDAP